MVGDFQKLGLKMDAEESTQFEELSTNVLT
jgi:hypothetical protein